MGYFRKGLLFISRGLSFFLVGAVGGTGIESGWDCGRI
jgi:hypothetical protein